ncbi:enoyl-CoA hydratase/isomerase family protein [Cupriavidus oxalaticus]|jgi:2-(1,2-epoxy-1,2-dihydrophenyl)acetyl-CoA isomerase|uniref:enoyl-CoA hydratase/isomerase family protein n=1 Tax=Cupriavidus oxalaticus TaxID=96344 RepID=UPI004033AC2B
MQRETIPLREARLEIGDGIAALIHDRPERRNPMSLTLRQDYTDMLDRVERDPKIRALIITGSGGSFCSGGDLGDLKSRVEHPDAPQNSPDAMRRRLLALHDRVARLRNLEMPVIAAVDGPALGAGMGLALVADFVLASPRAFFGMSFAKVGLVPDMASAYFLPRVVGMSMAKELMLTARKVGAEEAKQLGIVHAIYPHETLAEQARQFALRFVEAPPQAMGAMKRMLNSSFETSYGAFVELEANAQAVASTTAYHADALRRFAEGKPLRYDWDRVAKR